MASAVFEQLKRFWPLSLLKTDDLKNSRRHVRRLSVPELTKQFIFAIPDYKTASVVYILTVQNLSQQSVSDAENVIKEIQPDAVVAQIPPAALPEIQAEEETLDTNANSVPTSSFGVLRRCFKDKFDKNQYENLAGSLVLKEIFGTGFFGHLLAAKRAAEEANACFLLLESPHQNACMVASNVDTGIESQSTASLLLGGSLLPRKITAVVSPGSKSSWLFDPMQFQMVKSVTQSLSLSLSKPDSVLEFTADNCQPICNYQAPPFATVIYSLLADLHDIYVDLPAIGRALVYAQKMLTDVHKGESVNAQILKEVHNFRVAVEGLRIALNSAARCPLDKLVTKDSLEFDMLPPEEKCDALFTQALKNQAKKFKSVVAIVDAGTLSTLRRHWNTPVPSEEAFLSGQCFISFDEHINYERLIIEGMDRKRLIADTPVVAVGAGATALLGASSLSKALPASTLLKLVTYKVPAVLKFGLAHLQRTAAVGLSKILGSTKILAPGMASKASGFKATASAVKIRRITHSVIASAERTSLLAMRSAFYEIMRKRRAHPVGYAPWATFYCSMATCATLLSYGDGIECAAVSAPSAPTIASWGRGLQSLHQASQEVGQTNKTRVQEALQSLMYSLKKMEVQ